MHTEQIQKAYYDKLYSLYESHSGDTWSQKYRYRFINNFLLEGINLSGSNVLEAMCGSGFTTQYLISKGATVTGLDISEKSLVSFRKRWPNCNAVCASMHNSCFKDNSFGCVIITGGLHHAYPAINNALHEIHRILKTGGHLCFAEPYRGSMPDLIRRYWYKYDSLFAANERAIDIDKLKNDFSGYFKFDRERYLGNIGYLLVLNSLYLRIPLKIKHIYAPYLIFLESIFNKFQSRLFSCLLICQWQKK